VAEAAAEAASAASAASALVDASHAAGAVEATVPSEMDAGADRADVVAVVDALAEATHARVTAEAARAETAAAAEALELAPAPLAQQVWPQQDAPLDALAAPRPSDSPPSAAAQTENGFAPGADGGAASDDALLFHFEPASLAGSAAAEAQAAPATASLLDSAPVADPFGFGLGKPFDAGPVEASSVGAQPTQAAADPFGFGLLDMGGEQLAFGSASAPSAQPLDLADAFAGFGLSTSDATQPTQPSDASDPFAGFGFPAASDALLPSDVNDDPFAGFGFPSSDATLLSSSPLNAPAGAIAPELGELMMVVESPPPTTTGPGALGSLPPTPAFDAEPN
jgi:hypothetical protein